MNSQYLQSTLLACALVPLTAASQEPGEVPTQRDAKSVMTEAQELALGRERIGKRLMAVVADPEQPVVERQEAARLLGKLQYAPAIEVLIRHVDLVDPLYFSSEPRPDLQYPLMMALAAYGNAAVPQIVDHVASERNQLRRSLFFLCIHYHGKTTDVALRYLRGMKLEIEMDPMKTQNLESLEKNLTLRPPGQ